VTQTRPTLPPLPYCHGGSFPAASRWTREAFFGSRHPRRSRDAVPVAPSLRAGAESVSLCPPQHGRQGDGHLVGGSPGHLGGAQGVLHPAGRSAPRSARRAAHRAALAHSRAAPGDLGCPFPACHRRQLRPGRRADEVRPAAPRCPQPRHPARVRIPQPNDPVAEPEAAGEGAQHPRERSSIPGAAGREDAQHPRERSQNSNFLPQKGEPRSAPGCTHAWGWQRRVGRAGGARPPLSPSPRANAAARLLLFSSFFRPFFWCFGTFCSRGDRARESRIGMRGGVGGTSRLSLLPALFFFSYCWFTYLFNFYFLFHLCFIIFIFYLLFI